MQFTDEASPSRFLDRAGPLLLADEARHNLILGVAGTLVEHPDAYRASFLWLVEDRGDVVCADLVTPPFNAVVSTELEEGALALLAREVRSRSISLRGVTGALPRGGAIRDGVDARDACASRAPHDPRDLLARRGAPHAPARRTAPAGGGGRPRAAARVDRRLRPGDGRARRS